MVLQISTVLEPVGPATALELTDAQVVELGGGKRAPVRVTIGDRTVRLRLAGMGGKNLIGLSQAARKELGVAIGDAVTATVELDDAERVVEVPDDLGAALDADPRVRAAFDALAFSHRKELGVAIGDAVTATVELDDAERVLEVPGDLGAALDADPAVRAAFDALAFSHRKEHVRAVLEAKRPETRARRIAAVVKKISSGLTG
ncbi:MAG TPA: YdeI/OmpD-associated family protein, partial [Microlunatus sp.]|nr:YdeI/OmpD-associated family protein [Microlunatus sp.]